MGLLQDLLFKLKTERELKKLNTEVLETPEEDNNNFQREKWRFFIE